MLKRRAQKESSKGEIKKRSKGELKRRDQGVSSKEELKRRAATQKQVILRSNICSSFQSQPKYIETNNVYCSQGDQPSWNISVKPKTLLVHQIYRPDYQCVVSYQPFSLIAFGCWWARWPCDPVLYTVILKCLLNFVQNIRFLLKFSKNIPAQIRKTLNSY